VEQKRLALLIGVSNYNFANKLRNPLNDVNSMGSVLSKLGFEIIIYKDASFLEFKLALNEFGTKLNDYDIGLFYFAGHGIQVKGTNYLVPSDANPLNENQVEFDCINANQLLSLMSDASNDTNFIILDACRNNPFERSWKRSLAIQGLSYMSAPYGTLIAYSTAPDKTASDGEGNNGLYTSVLIDEILSPNLTILQVLQNVRSKLIKISNGEQVPWESTSLLNDFVFNDNRYISISTFCQSILYSRDRDIVLNNLKLNNWDLNKVTKLNIPINRQDKEAGIIEVYYKDKLNYFDIFNTLEIHIYKNGQRDYSLFTSTKDASHVYAISQEIFNKLGGGLYDDEKFSSFKEFDKIKNIAKGKAKSAKEQCLTLWYFDNVTFILKYLIAPKKQFIFTINVKPTKKVIQRTIAELLVNDYYSFLSSAIKVEPTGKYEGKFVDYHISLTTPEFNFFDAAIVKLFPATKTSQASSNVFLTNSKGIELDVSQVSSLIAKITSIYGVDRSGEGYLTGFEELDLKNKRFWSGREWDLNIQHQIYDMNSSGEEMLYGVHLHYDDEMNTFELGIIGYEGFLNFIKG
jgi:hypothetical protein